MFCFMFGLVADSAGAKRMSLANLVVLVFAATTI